MPKNTPVPWLVDASHPEREGVYIWTANEDTVLIAEVIDGQHGQARENAKFIVRAVNAYDDLLSALRSVACPVCSGYYGDRHVSGCTSCEAVRQLISKAEGKETPNERDQK